MSQDIERNDSFDIKSYVHAVEEICGYVRNQLGVIPSIGLVIGSGLQEVALSWFPVEREINLPELLDYPGLVSKNAPFATIRKVGEHSLFCIESGVYGKQTMPQLALPIRVKGILGIEAMIMMTSCCSLKPGIQPGDVCVIADHINVLGNSPLVGENIEEWGPRFPDMTEPYDIDFRQHCQDVALGAGLKIHESILTVIPESEHGGAQKDEFEYLRRLGADIVGVDGVPEVIVARHMDLRVLGIACILDFCLEEQHAKQLQQGTAASEESRPVVPALVNAIASLS